MSECRRVLCSCCTAFVLLSWPLSLSVAQTARSMTVVTPFTQGRVSQGMSNVSYRVGGVFAEAAEPARHVSLTFLCKEGGNFSIVMVHRRVPRQPDGQTEKIGVQVDDQTPQRIGASRKIGEGLTAFTVENATDAAALARTLGGGTRLRLELDNYAYDIPLQGLDAALGRLAAVCPYG